MDLTDLLSEAGFENVNESEYLRRLIEVNDECKVAYVAMGASKERHTERGISVPNSKIYYFFTTKDEDMLEGLEFYRIYEVPEDKFYEIAKKHSTIQKEGIEPICSGIYAVDFLIRIKKARDDLRNELTQGTPAGV